MITHHSFFGRDELSVSMHYAEGWNCTLEGKAKNETFVCLYKWTFYILKGGKKQPTTATNDVCLHLFSISDFLILFLPRKKKVHVNLVIVLNKLQIEIDPGLVSVY